jgi:hypothetical protein
LPRRLRFSQFHHLLELFLKPPSFASSTVSSAHPSAAHGRTRLEWLTGQLKRKLESPGFVPGKSKSAVAWYMRFGFSMGVSRADLQAALSSVPELHAIAVRLSDEEVCEGIPPPEFARGQLVEVIAGPGSAPSHKGTVRGLCWHQQEGQWVFFIKEDRRNMSRLYETKDLRAVTG